MARVSRAVCCVLIGFAALIVGGTTLADDEKSTKELIAADDAWSDAAVARDVDRVASFYAADGIAYPPDEPTAVGSAATRKVWANYFADPTYKISWKTTAAEVVNDTGWTAGTFEDSSAGPDGKRIAKTGKYLCVWHRSADHKWKAVHDMWNYDAK